MPKINPYLNFDDNTEEVFNFYKSVFGGEFATIMRFKEAPSDPGNPSDESEGEKIMHIALPIGKDNMLMASDTPKSMGPVEMGNNISLSISADNKEEADKLFKSLSEGGSVIMPLEKAFWGSYFGMLTDKFGVNWMISCD